MLEDRSDPRVVAVAERVDVPPGEVLPRRVRAAGGRTPDPRAPAAGGDPRDLVRAGPHPRHLPGQHRGDRDGWPRAGRPWLVPRGLLGAPRGRAARDPGPGDVRHPPGIGRVTARASGPLLGPWTRDARARRG